MKTDSTLKICAAVCEYNPFHNGHAYHLSQMKATNADITAVVMSGNFTQRGEPAVLDKYVRARHACLAGADIVVELPTVFATANAQIFAEGALKLIGSMPGQKTLCFGAETPDKQAFLAAGKALSTESKAFKDAIKQQLKKGVPFAEARANALQKTGEVNPQLLASPNNILGLEYTRAIQKNSYAVDIAPILRTGADHLESKVKGEIASSSAIRGALAEGNNKAAKKSVPPHVFEDLRDISLPDFDALYRYSLLMTDAQTLAKTPDCSEGLENRIKALVPGNPDYATLLSKIATKRYTDARIRRICTANLLAIRDDLVQKSLTSSLYLKVLAVREDSAALSLLSQSAFPLIARMSDYDKLSPAARQCFEKDLQATALYTLAGGRRYGDFHVEYV